jgi:hypothetical protein
MRLASVSVDLDEVNCYTDIHALQSPPPNAAHAIYCRALPRFRDLFAQTQIRATFFAIGRDLQHEPNAALIAELHQQGHEIANHSLDHYYDLIRRDRDTIRAQVAQGAEAIEKVTGARPVGFRAPGYSVSDALFEILAELSVGYDSSVFPCPAYYGLKALALAAIRSTGRRSRSILTNPFMLSVPAEPYRVGKPYWKRGNGMLEIPVAVTSWLSGRLPFIGTSLVLGGAAGARWLSRRMVGMPLINLELHGIDLADAEQEGLDFLHQREPALRRSLGDKQQALRAAVELLGENGYRFVPLAEAAAQFSGGNLTG